MRRLFVNFFFFSFFSTFLPVVKEQGGSLAFCIPFIFQTKKLNENLKPQSESCSLQDFSRLGGEVYINNLFGSSSGNLD